MAQGQAALVGLPQPRLEQQLVSNPLEEVEAGISALAQMVSLELELLPVRVETEALGVVAVEPQPLVVLVATAVTAAF